MGGGLQPKASEEKHVFLMLDALRGIAAISIVVFHYSLNLEHQLLPNSFLAVDFFFVLSGFVVAHAYENRLTNGLSFRQFALLRLRRLYPLYFLGMTLPLIVAGIQILSEQPHFSRSLLAISYITEIFFLPTPGIFSTGAFGTFPLNTPAWSLSLEIAINLVYAAFCKNLTTRLLSAFTLLAGFGLLTASLNHGGLNIGSDWSSYFGGWARVFWSFPTGILLYRIFKIRKRREYPLWAGILLAFSLVAIFAYDNTGPISGLVFAFVIFPLIVFLGACVKIDGAARNVASWLGGVSYAVYLTHYGILQIFTFSYQLLGNDPKTHFLSNLLIWTVIAVLCGWIADVAYDIPVRKFLRRKWE